MSSESAATRLRLLLAVFLVACSAAAFAADARKAIPARKFDPPPWAALTADQQQVLAPLRPHWDELDTARKKKWIGVAGRYPAMNPAEQQRVQRRMEAWAKLSPEDRRKARESYLDLSRLPPEQKQDLREKWAEYQSLSPAERSQLQAPPAPDAKGAERKRRAKPAPTPPSPQTFPSP